MDKGNHTRFLNNFKKILDLLKNKGSFLVFIAMVSPWEATQFLFLKAPLTVIATPAEDWRSNLSLRTQKESAITRPPKAGVAISPLCHCEPPVREAWQSTFEIASSLRSSQ